MTQAKLFHILSGLLLTSNLTILVLLDKIVGEWSIFPNSGWFAWIVGKAHVSRSSAINLGNVDFSGLGRVVNIRQKSSLLKCREQIFECFDGFQWAHLWSTKWTHLFCLLIISKKQNFMEANSVVRVWCFAAAVHYTSIKHNKPCFSHRWLSRSAIPLLLHELLSFNDVTEN